MPPSVPMDSSSPMASPILDSLAGIRRKVRTLSVVYGIGIVLAAAVGLILCTIFLDYLLNLPIIPRFIFVLASVAGTAYALVHWVIKPLLARLSLGDVAGRLENVFPQFDDRLRSTVNFAGGQIDGSSVMKQRVISEAGQLTAAVNLDDALIKKPVLLSMAIGIGAIVLAIALGFLFSDYARIARNRLFLGSDRYPRRVQISVVKGLPAKIAAGQRMDLRMKLVKGDKPSMQPIVFYKYDDGSVQKQIMNRADDGTYTVSLDARGSAMSVWMKAGDDETPPQNVAVVQRLAINRVEAIVTPPSYAKLEASTANLSEAPATVVFGSHVDLKVSFNKTLSQDKPVAIEPVKADAKLPEIQWHQEGAGVAVGSFTATQSMRFRIRATDTDYFDNTALEEYELIVRPDQTPTVIIEMPRRNEDRTAIAMVRLEILAEDDFDISTMTLVVDRLGENKKRWEVPLSGWMKVDASGERRRFREKYDWELKDLEAADLKPGDVLEYFVKVTDNYSYNGAVHEPATSGHLKINIISQEQLSNQITEALRAAAEKVRTTQNTQNRTKEETRNLRQDTEKRQQMDAADRTALARLNDQQSTLASQTKQLAGQVSEVEKRMEENRSENQDLKNIAKDVKTTLNDAAENAMTEASRKLTEAANKADPRAGKNEKGQNDPKKAEQSAQERSQALEKSEQKQQEASDQLSKALDKMSNLGSLENLINKVRDALAKQQELSKQLKEAGKETIGKTPTPEQQKKLDQVAAEQKKAAEKTEKLTQELNKASNQMKQSDPASSKAMEQAAKQAQQQQVQSNQQQAAQQAQQNQQAEAQAKQKQAELGLQMMLDTLREAERRKLEQLAKELAKLQQLIDNLIRRQAGHNIDNLAIQKTPTSLKLITDELIQEADRIREKMPPTPDVPNLTAFQTTTEKNTRDVAHTAEDLPKGGAEIAAILSKAAGLMERAIVSLRDAKLPEAYDPSQVKALASLEEAKAKADEVMAQVAEKQEDANRETIRQVYEKVRAEQDGINKETTRIDANPRLPDGSYTRVDSVNLAKLPGQEGTLADKTKKLEEDLSALGGIVYVWANKDIVDSMNQVKDDLAKPTTAKPTRAEEQRIVDQLDAMIRNLAIKRKPSEFKNPPGGGGGGGQGQPPKPKLPSEAELRLLKELQIAVNKSTKTISDDKNPDKPKLVALGNRQGELRGLLDQLIQKASENKVKLDPEPDPKDRLPEEAGTAQIENQELDEWLRGAKTGDDQLTDDVKLVGQRMARSRQRLALDNDPGKTTQAIQDRILNNLDNLIAMARQQQAQARSRPGKGQGQGQRQQRPQQGDQGQQQARDLGMQQQQNQGLNPRQVERGNGTQDNNAQGKDIREKASEWGGLTPREREAVIEGTHDKVIQKYKKLTDDYYEQMGKKGSQDR